MAPFRPQLRIDTNNVPITIEPASPQRVRVCPQAAPEYSETTTSGASGSTTSGCALPHRMLYPHDPTMCRTMSMPREDYTARYPAPLPNIASRSRTVDYPIPPGTDWFISSAYTEGRKRITFNEGGKLGVGMLDLLTYRDSLSEDLLFVPSMFDPRYEAIRVVPVFLGYGLPRSSQWCEVTLVSCSAPNHGNSDLNTIYVARYQLAMRIAFLYWQHQHPLNLPSFDRLRLLSLHATIEGLTWIPEILVL